MQGEGNYDFTRIPFHNANSPCVDPSLDNVAFIDEPRVFGCSKRGPDSTETGMALMLPSHLQQDALYPLVFRSPEGLKGSSER